MYTFLLFEPIHEAGRKVLEKVGEVHMASATDEDTIISEIGDVDAAIVRARGGITRRILENAPNLKVVGRHGVGVDNIDLEACTEHGVQVVNTPQATVESVAEHTVGLMLCLSKRIAYANFELRKGRFEVRYSIDGQEMLGRTLGVVGFGRIGRRVGEICHRAFDMPVLYSDVRPAPEVEEELGARRLTLPELLSAAEYVTVHVPLLPETRGLIGEPEFELMGPEALFFNTSRGAVVDEDALCRALQEGMIAGAGLDVFEQEPTPADNPLLDMENVVVTPHMATATKEALRNMSLVTEDVVGVLEGKPPQHPVNEV